jgi:hypothetical protein
MINPKNERDFEEPRTNQIEQKYKSLRVEFVQIYRKRAPFCLEWLSFLGKRPSSTEIQRLIEIKKEVALLPNPRTIELNGVMSNLIMRINDVLSNISRKRKSY